MHSPAVGVRGAGRTSTGSSSTSRTRCSGSTPYEGTPPPIWLAAHGPRMLRIMRRARRRLAADQHQARGLRREARRDPRERREGGPRPRRDHAVDAGLRDLRARRGDARADVRVAPRAAAVRGRRPIRPRPTSATARRRRSRADRASTRSCPRPSRREEASGSSTISPAASFASTRCAGRRTRSPTRSAPTSEVGLRDVVLWNITPFADPALSVYSFKAMKAVRELLAGEPAATG